MKQQLTKIIALFAITAFLVAAFPRSSSASLIFAFLQATSSTTDTNTYTFAAQNLGAAAADRCIVVFAAGRKTGGTTSLSSMTIGGVSATIVAQVARNVTNTNAGALAAAIVPSGTTGDIVVTWADTMAQSGIGVWRATQVDDCVTPIDTFTSVIDDPGGTVDVAPGGFAIAGAVNSGSAVWVGAGGDLVENYDATIEAIVQHTAVSRWYGLTAPATQLLAADFFLNTESLAVGASWDDGAEPIVPSTPPGSAGVIRGGTMRISGGTMTIK